MRFTFRLCAKDEKEKVISIVSNYMKIRLGSTSTRKTRDHRKLQCTFNSNYRMFLKNSNEDGQIRK